MNGLHNTTLHQWAILGLPCQLEPGSSDQRFQKFPCDSWRGPWKGVVPELQFLYNPALTPSENGAEGQGRMVLELEFLDNPGLVPSENGAGVQGRMVLELELLNNPGLVPSESVVQGIPYYPWGREAFHSQYTLGPRHVGCQLWEIRCRQQSWKRFLDPWGHALRCDRTER